MTKSEPSRHPVDILDRLENQGYIVNETLTRNGLQSLVQTLMDIEVSQILDASRYERSATRRAYRNGYRVTMWDTSIGEIELGIPKLRQGTYYPERLLNDRNVAHGLIRLVKLTVIGGIDEATVADLLSRLNLFPLSTHELHRICDGLHEALGQVKDHTDVETPIVSEKRIPLYQRKHLLLMRKRNTGDHLENITDGEINQVDKEFWRDFTRRMSQAGLIVENHQSVLSHINPYARLEVEDVESSFRSSFAQHILTLYEDQLIA